MRMILQGSRLMSSLCFINWCKDVGVVRSSEYLEVRRIDCKVLETLDTFVKDRAKD